MNKEFYLNIYSKFENKESKKILNILNEIITSFIYITFPIFLAYLFITKNPNFIRITLTTLIPFILLSVFRNIYNAKRPYELFETTPILNKDSKGKSFPSRHVFSIFVIGMSSFFIIKFYGIIALILGVFLAIIRVVGGVHFIKDVSVGALIGIISGIIGMTI